MRTSFAYGLTTLICLLCIMAGFGTAQSTINVVTTLPDLASIVGIVGGNHVKVTSIAQGYQDPHFVDAKPSYMINLQKADLFVQVGLDLEIGWVPLLIDGARNPKILPGAKGYLDASRGVPLLEVPSGDPSQLRAQGDIHVYGNPHYWLDPQRAKVVADNIVTALSSLQPENASNFRKNADEFARQIDEKTKGWIAKLSPYRGSKIVAFHNSWPYFIERFGLKIEAFIEPKPGIPPTPKHLVSLIRLIQDQKIGVIIIEPYYSRKSAEVLAEKTGAQIVELATSVGAEKSIQNYFDLFDYDINALVAALAKTAQH